LSTAGAGIDECDNLKSDPANVVKLAIGRDFFAGG
jgi:hypothetical protein